MYEIRRLLTSLPLWQLVILGALLVLSIVLIADVMARRRRRRQEERRRPARKDAPLQRTDYGD